MSSTMFSDHKKERHYTVGSQSSTPSFPPQSPYSPGRWGERSLSCQSSGLLESDITGINLHESLLEFTALQDKIKQEQDLFLDPTSTLDSNLSTHHNFSLSSPPAHNYPLSPLAPENFPLSPQNPHSYPLSPSTSHSSNPIPSPGPDGSHTLHGIKMEPMEFLDQSSRKSAVLCTVTSNVHAHSQTSDLLHSTLIQSTPPRTISSSNTLLKQSLSDTSFQTKYNLKPFDFGVTTGLVYRINLFILCNSVAIFC